MYGLINESLKLMIVEEYGLEIWKDLIKDNDELPVKFDSFSQYPDEITGVIVLKTCEQMRASPEDLLEKFGLFWIEYSKHSEYAGILETFSTGPIDLITSLDKLHTRLEMAFSDLSAPSFWISSEKETSLQIHYQSSRDLPLEYMVIGLIKGIFKLFNRECSIEIIKMRGKGTEAIFRLDYEN